MRELTQTILAGDPAGRTGNCFQTAVACILDMDLEQVPHFCETGDWLGYVLYWGALQGWSVTRYHRTSVEGIALGVAGGPGPRGYHHAVAVVDGRIAWDPHPSRAGLLSVDQVWDFARADPADTRHQMLVDDAERYIAAILAEPPVRRLGRSGQPHRTAP